MRDPIWFDDDAYCAGQDAQTRGLDRNDNPYTDIFPAIWWGIGWEDSETESMKHEVGCD